MGPGSGVAGGRLGGGAVPAPAPSLSPDRGFRTSRCSPFCPVYTALSTDSRLHPPPSPTCWASREAELSAVSGTWPQRAPQSLSEKGTALNTLLAGTRPPPMHTFCPGSPLLSLCPARRHQVPSAPQALTGPSSRSTVAGWLPRQRAVGSEGGWPGAAVQAVDLTCKVRSAQLCTPETSTGNRGALQTQAPQYLSEKDGAPARVVPSRCWARPCFRR